MKHKKVPVRETKRVETWFILRDTLWLIERLIQHVRATVLSQLALRPIHLTRPERVKAHVSICILAYLLMNTMEMVLRNAGESTSSTEVLRQWQSCQSNEVGLKHSSKRSITMTEMTEQQKQWIKQLQCKNYLKPKVLKQITESLQK